jgi:hypothetical protein
MRAPNVAEQEEYEMALQVCRARCVSLCVVSSRFRFLPLSSGFGLRGGMDEDGGMDGERDVPF